MTIPTHLRVMMDAAALLHASGKYEPVIIYCPSAVFDQNYANCQQAPYETYVWSGVQFLLKNDYMNGNWRFESSNQVPLNQRDANWLSRLLPGLGTREWLKRHFPLLEHVAFRLARAAQHYKRAFFNRVIFYATPVAGFAIRNYGILATLSTSLASALLRPPNQPPGPNYGKQPRLRRFLLNLFASEWNAASIPGRQLSNDTIHRLSRFTSRERLLNGLIDQKSIFTGMFDLIRNQKPAMVVLPEANLFYNSQFIVRAAHLNSTPVTIVPFTIVNTLEWAEAFYDVPRFHANKGWNQLFAKAFPNWVLKHRGRSLILPPIYILACEYFDMVPDVPWLINSGNADAIAAESQFMCDYYIRAGIQKQKVHLTGALSDDKLFQLQLERNQRRKELGAQLDSPMRDRIVLIGLPPNQFGGGKRPGCEFDSYDELISYMVSAVSSICENNATVLINLHPRIKPSEVAFLTSLGATIVDNPIENLVALSDVYIAVASATIRLGISCGVPVVNYDAYQYSYDDYNGLAGVCEVKSKTDFETVVNDLINDQEFYSKILTAQKATASNLCLVDGRAGDRLIALIEHLSSNFSKAQ